MPEDIEGAQPSIVAGLVSYITKPEAYFVTGAFVAAPGKIFAQGYVRPNLEHRRWSFI